MCCMKYFTKSLLYYQQESKSLNMNTLKITMKTKMNGVDTQ